MKKIGLIALALVLALGAMGVGIAQWTETLTITGSVETGNLAVGWEDCETSDEDLGTGIDLLWNANCGDPAPVDNVLDKDIGSISQALEGKLYVHTANDAWVYETLHVTVDNAYPGFAAYVSGAIGNAGDIPVKVVSVKVVHVNGGGGDVNIKLLPFTPKPVDLDGDGDNDVCFVWHPWDDPDPDMVGEPVVIQPCQVEEPGMLAMGFLEGLDEEDSLTFDIEVTAMQWNAVGP